MKYLVLFLGVLFFAGCSATRITVEKEFWQDSKDKRIGVIVTKFPEPYTFKMGSQGLLDVVINNAIASGLTDHLLTIDVNSFNEIKSKFKSKLEEKGYNNIVVVEESVNLDSLPVFRGQSGKKVERKDFNKYKELYKLDLLLVFSVNRYGTIREYYGFIPLGAPKGFFEVKGRMFDPVDNKYKWFFELNEEEASQTIMGEWDEEPDYPNLTKAVLEAMEESEDLLENHFFNVKDEE